ncbi:MAG: hypothetical protein WAW59_02100 [Patescibacteria group bacterium]
MANIDHIMPQSIFDSSEKTRGSLLRDALFNLCPLPERDNQKKNDKKLNEISDQWLKDQIKDYAFIDESEYLEFSSIMNWEKLRDKRRLFFEGEFIVEREKRFNLE